MKKFSIKGLAAVLGAANYKNALKKYNKKHGINAVN